MCVMRIFTVRGETDISLKLEIMMHLFGKASSVTSVQPRNSSFTSTLLKNEFHYLAVLCDFAATLD